MGVGISQFQSQWLERNTVCRLERWVSKLGIWLRLTQGQLAKKEKRKIDQRLERDPRLG